MRFTSDKLYGLAYIALVFSMVATLGSVTVQAEPVISRQFKTNSSDASQGLLVSVSTSPDTVEAADTQNSTKLAGVVVDRPLVELASSDSYGVDVASTGTVQTYVSDINGQVNNGDSLTVSPVKGVAMKASQSDIIIGTAGANLASSARITKNIQKSGGKTTQIHIGLMPVQLASVHYAPNSGSASDFPLFQGVADNVAGKHVSALRIMLATLCLLLGFGVVFAVVHAGIRNGVIAIGRNPLAEHAIRKGLTDAIFIAGGTLILTTVMVLVILRA